MGKIKWCDVLFLASYRGRSTEMGSLTFRILCKCEDLNSKLELFHSLFVLLCQILVHRLRWTRVILRKDNKPSPDVVVLQCECWVLFLGCLVLCFWPVVPFILSRENFRKKYFMFVFYRQGRSKWLWAAINARLRWSF